MCVSKGLKKTVARATAKKTAATVRACFCSLYLNGYFFDAENNMSEKARGDRDTQGDLLRTPRAPY